MCAAPDERVDPNGFEQHEENEHTYPCPKCSEIFKTEAAMDQVRHPVVTDERNTSFWLPAR